jgi:hypothetical protein
MNAQDFKFTFETEAEYTEAQMTGYIDSFDIVRVTVIYDHAYQVNFPLKSREEFYECLANTSARGGQITELYQAVHSYDIMDYAE